MEYTKSKKDLMSVAETRLKQAEGDRVSIRKKLNELRKAKAEEVSLVDSQVLKLRNELHSINQVHGVVNCIFRFDGLRIKSD